MIHKCFNDQFPWELCIGKIWILRSLVSFNIENCTFRVGPGVQTDRIYLVCMTLVQSIVVTKKYLLWKKTKSFFASSTSVTFKDIV